MTPDYFSNMTIEQLWKIIVGVIVVISTIVEMDKKIPFHPITFVFRSIGKMFNKDLYDKINDLEKQQVTNNTAIIELDKKVDKKFKEQQKEADEKEAKRLRASIISFSDSCRVHNKHTKNHFENVLRDYDDYMEYCEKHSLANHYIDGEYKYIQSVYQECLKENKFL